MPYQGTRKYRPRQPNVECICATCGETFTRSHSKTTTHPTSGRHCGVACQRAGHPPTTAECVTCGKTFAVAPARLRKGARFCSVECRHAGHRPIATACDKCGGEFLAHPYKFRNGQGKYCSRACSASAIHGVGPVSQVEVACIACGETYMAWPYRLRDGSRFCSHACYSRAKLLGEARVCPVCGATFYVSASRQQRTEPVLTCSNRCRGVLKRTPEGEQNRNARKWWQNSEWRKAVYRRDNFTCRICGSRGVRTLHAHHIKLWHAFPEDRFDLNNGVTLCQPCHERLHSMAGRKAKIVPLPA